MKSCCPDVLIGSPAIANGRYGLPWLISFISDLGGLQACGIDQIVLHVYSSSIDDFKTHIEEVYNTFGLPIWVTEFACSNLDPKAPVSEEDVLKFMREAVQFLEQEEYVDKYAWFGAMENIGEDVGRANALQKRGELTEAGKLYLYL